jgi:hypothetical protein
MNPSMLYVITAKRAGVMGFSGVLDCDTETQRLRERQTANGFATEITENGNGNGGKDVHGNGNGERRAANGENTEDGERQRHCFNHPDVKSGFPCCSSGTEDMEINYNSRATSSASNASSATCFL